MDDLISRQAAIDAAECIVEHHSITPYKTMAAAMDHLKRILNGVPSAQPERIKGRWVRKESDLSWWYECSECGESPLFDPYEHEVLTPFCPWCGEKMRGEDDAVD